MVVELGSMDGVVYGDGKSATPLPSQLPLPSDAALKVCGRTKNLQSLQIEQFAELESFRLAQRIAVDDL